MVSPCSIRTSYLIVVVAAVLTMIFGLGSVSHAEPRIQNGAFLRGGGLTAPAEEVWVDLDRRVARATIGSGSRSEVFERSLTTADIAGFHHLIEQVKQVGLIKAECGNGVFSSGKGIFLPSADYDEGLSILDKGVLRTSPVRRCWNELAEKLEGRMWCAAGHGLNC